MGMSPSQTVSSIKAPVPVVFTSRSWLGTGLFRDCLIYSELDPLGP